MTFYYDSDENELVGNCAGEYATFEGVGEREELHIDVTEIMENGRGLRKLREMESAIQSAIDKHEDT